MLFVMIMFVILVFACLYDDILYIFMIFMILFSFDALCLHDHDVVSGRFLCSLLLVCDFCCQICLVKRENTLEFTMDIMAN